MQVTGYLIASTISPFLSFEPSDVLQLQRPWYAQFGVSQSRFRVSMNFLSRILRLVRDWSLFSFEEKLNWFGVGRSTSTVCVVFRLQVLVITESSLLEPILKDHGSLLPAW